MSEISKPAQPETHEAVAEQMRQARTGALRNAQGDAVGSDFVAPKGNFAQFLGYAPPTPAEQRGEAPVSGGRVLELALQKEMQDLGQSAASRGADYANVGNAGGDKFSNQPGREHDLVRDGVDSMHQAVGRDKVAGEKAGAEDRAHKDATQISPQVAPYVEKVGRLQTQSHNDNVRYLEMQYKFQEISKQNSTISNLMKARHETISRTIRGNQG